jgi:serine/threonine protein kinase
VYQEVASLLETYPAAEGFLSTPASPAEVAAAIPRLRHLDRLAHFEIDQLIGVGGMGELYRARDTRLDRDVAIKLLAVGAGAEGRPRRARSPRNLQLTHPRISRLYDVGSMASWTSAVAGNE